MLKSKKFWGFLASFFFLWLALRNVDWKMVPATLAGLDLRLLVLMFFTYTLEHLARAYRWRAILSGRPLKIKHAWFGIILGYLFNNLLPARAGEFIRSFYLKRKNTASASEVFGSVVFERFLDGVIIMTMLVFSLHHFKTTDLIRKASYSAMFFYGVILAVILLLQFRRRLFERLTLKVFNFFPAAVAEKLNRLRESFTDGLGLIARPRLFFRALTLSAFCWVLSVWTLYVCMRMFNLDFGLAEAVLCISVLAIGSMIPTSPGMIGIYEFCCVLVLHGMLGQTEEVAAMFGVVSHTISYLYVLLAGFVVLSLEGLSFADLRQNRNDEMTQSQGAKA